jgi:hypothetical protein
MKQSKNEFLSFFLKVENEEILMSFSMAFHTSLALGP